MSSTARDVMAVIAEQLGQTDGEFDADATFVASGADSLNLMALARAVRSRFGVQVSVRELFGETDTPRKLGAAVAERAGHAGTPSPADPAGMPPERAPHLSGHAPQPSGYAPHEPASRAAARTVRDQPHAPASAAPAPESAPGPGAPVPGSAGAPVPGVPAAPAGAPGPGGTGAPEAVWDVLNGQLRTVEKMMSAFSELAAEQLRVMEGVRTGPDGARLPDASTAPREPAVLEPPAIQAPLAASAAPVAPAPGAPPAVPAVPAVAPAAPSAPEGEPPAGPLAPAALPPGAAAVPARPVVPARSGGPAHRPVDFSLYFFGDYPAGVPAVHYEHLLEAATFADERGFHAVWIPERHFHSFGALFPNPSVVAAALATRTSRIRLNAGSVVLPLHDPIRVAEEWAVVDNLSHGRVGLGLASGWHSRDFVLAPQNYSAQRDVMYAHLDTFRKLWSGRPHTARSGSGEDVQVQVHPRPVQDEPPLFAAVLSNPESYERAARGGLGIVTNLMAQGVDDLRANIARYRRARAEQGLDPDGGRVVVLVHTYLADDGDRARREARGPFCDYLRSSLNLFSNMANSLGFDVDLDGTTPDDLDFVLEQAYERYCETRALIGSAEEARPVLDSLVAAGADEIGCFVDFGVAPDLMLAALHPLDRLREQYVPPLRTARDRAAHPQPAPAAGRGHALPVPTGRDESGHMAPAADDAPRDTPATALQRRMWLLERMDPGSHTYYEPKALLLEGPLDVTALQAALNRVVRRHPQLRTVFRERDGVLRQVVLDTVTVPCPVTELSGLDAAAAVDRLREVEDRHDLDLAAGPLLRAHLARLDGERHLLYLVAHHIVFDALSMGVFCRDLAAFYRAWPGEPEALAGPGPRVPSPSAEGPAAAEHLAKGLAFWKERLAGAQPLALPTDRRRSAGVPASGASVVHEMDAELAEAVREVARGQGSTLFMALLGAVGSVLGRFAAQDDVVLGMAVTNRPEGAQDVVGMFVETVALRLDLSGDPDFAALLRHVRGRAAEAFEYQDIPFDQVVEAVNPDRVAGQNPLFQVMVEFEQYTAPDFGGTSLTAELMDVPRPQAPFDLALYFTHHDRGVRCTAEYDAALFDAGTVRRVLAHVEHLLRHATAFPGVPLTRLPALPEQDERLLADWQGRRTDEDPACLHELVEEQARRTPDAVALEGDGPSRTYRDLDEDANRLAHRLIAGGLAPGGVAALAVPRGAAFVTAVLAVLKCGAAYLPLDGSLPAERRRLMVEQTGARLVLADGGADPFDGAAPDADGTGTTCPVLWIDETPADTPRTPPGIETDPGDTAYYIYTSGSTGSPKAVAVPHRGPVNLVRWQRRTLGALRTLQWTSVGFDVSVQEIFTTLASGSTLVVLDDETRYDPDAVAAHLRTHRVERMSLPFTPLKYLAAHIGHMPNLRQLFIAGEKLVLTPELRALAEANPQLDLYNQYGPTEASVVVTSHHVDPAADDFPPIGRPIDNVTVRVVDHRGRPAPVGAVGELLIGGVPLAYGYHGDEEGTARAFGPSGTDGAERFYHTGDLVRWRSDGTLEYQGRLDSQVKIRGHRVEPAEPESLLGRLPQVKEAVVLARPDRTGELELAAYVVLRDPGADAAGWRDVLRAQLAIRLPHYLVPQAWTRVDAIPHGPHGKLDRHRLLAMETAAHGGGGRAAGPAGGAGAAAGPAGAASAVRGGDLGDLEARVGKLWSVELGTDDLEPERSFFDMGGNSLTAVRLLERVRMELGRKVPVADFLKGPTIRALTARLAELGA
ncbi:hypothetical protein GCM10018793_69620 [Streptomyces sulfonofaciens]|uniref:Carrier domain-containing protein n=1 Tax=Streptomyces sulfonofaciens TaxID=68272 RepID=A0A919GQ52_9ACTN|nr:non-ribosomal peptide synthetase [Streptomyces sulfonofaciens]GHH88748.1 hypothetical protein GCM10018793_69620 [Streptomyces sulfonofaciens]